MCKYCKRLEEVRKKDRDEFNRVVNSWRRHCYKAEVLITKAIDLLDEFSGCTEVCEEDVCEAELLISALLDWKSKDCVG